MHTLLTIDVELSPTRYKLHPTDLATNIRGSYYGDREERWGLRDQLDTLQHHRLKAVFFVEALSPVVTGLDHLSQVCELISDYGHEIQLHMHPEWFSFTSGNEEPLTSNMWMLDLPLQKQFEAIRIGLENLVDAGVDGVIAHRAGAFGANRDTLRACEQAGLGFDSSYNAAMLGSPCALQQETEQTRPRRIENVWEVPMSCFRQAGGRARPLQVCAVSFAEMRQTLQRLQRVGAPVATILSHSFELLTRDRERVQPIHARRFNALCALLADNRDRFKTVGFRDLDPTTWVEQDWNAAPVGVAAPLTAMRYVSQAIGRMYE